MDIVQSFYDDLASNYDKLFSDWQRESKDQGEFLCRLFKEYGFDKSATVLDCACGIGTQAIGIGALGYQVTGSDISEKEIEQAKRRAEQAGVSIDFKRADFRKLEDTFSGQFDIVLAMDNALPHMLTKEELERAIKSIMARVKEGGIFVASIRDYDALTKSKPPYSPPYIHKTDKGQRVSFQTWEWKGDNYRLIQYIIEDESKLSVNRFECEYRTVKRQELSDLLTKYGCSQVEWKLPQECDFYQPVVIGKK